MTREPAGHQPEQPGISRRRMLGFGSALALGALTAGAASAAAGPAPATAPAGPFVPRARNTANQQAALDALGRTSLRTPGSLPFPDLAPGTDTLQGIDHIVVLIMENHSYDNIFGMLGRGDGLAVDAAGRPTATMPYGYPDVRTQRAFRMPTSCQGGPLDQSWQASHLQFDGGAMDGFVSATVNLPDARVPAPVAMSYFDEGHLPFTYSLARQFPIGDRWFCSLLGQTSPNRRFVIGATSGGMTDDPSTDAGNLQNIALAAPIGPTIFNRLDDYGISWANYYVDFPLGATPEEFPWADTVTELIHRKPWAQFFTDAAAGALPSFTFLDEAMNQSQDEDEDDQHPPFFMGYGDDLLSQVVNALAASPQWPSTMLIVAYDEHGGYYDHVPPPPALDPDGIPPLLSPGVPSYEGFTRYGMRVPSVVVSPYAKQNHVSHVLYDHTSILATIERKWNLPALTHRDANANDLTDFLDLDALAARRPTFPRLPPLAAPGTSPGAMSCMTTGPGTIPAPGSVSYGTAGPSQFSAPGADGTWGAAGPAPAAFYSAHPAATGVDLDNLRNAQRIAVCSRTNASANSYYVVTGADGIEYLQTAGATGSYRGFQALPGNAGAPSFAAPRIAATAMPDGDAQILAVGLDGKLYHTIYFAGSDTFQPWGALNWGASDASIAAAPNGDAQIVGIGLDGKLYHNIRFASNSWQGFLPPATNGLAPGALQRTCIAADPANGDSHVLVLDGAGRLSYLTRHGTSGWSSRAGADTWGPVADGSTYGGRITDLCAAVAADGRLHIGVVTSGGSAFEQVLDTAAGTATPPAPLPSPTKVQSISLCPAASTVTAATVQLGG
ncbi:alkaline phosphatase family protein [Kitasatospora mediocidica]|uniref:alkaline phosphatase family protein n=1 Tax=Kitasatospora mediocidica TaxID=58352 RepID=UPI00055BFDA7|nr:alkaline phosphatase family protein [Kitasatospora mediocidica]